MFIGQSIKVTVFIGVIFLIREGDRQTAPLPMLCLALLFFSVCCDCFKTLFEKYIATLEDCSRKRRYQGTEGEQ